eukprot:scaffold321097_cov19-Tisochrysis_lutea.AAC.1
MGNGSAQEQEQSMIGSNRAEGGKVRKTEATGRGTGGRAQLGQQGGDRAQLGQQASNAVGVEASGNTARHKDWKREEGSVEQLVWDRQGGWNWQVGHECIRLVPSGLICSMFVHPRQRSGV